MYGVGAQIPMSVLHSDDIFVGTFDGGMSGGILRRMSGGNCQVGLCLGNFSNGC